MGTGDLTLRVDLGEITTLLTEILGRMNGMATQADLDQLAQQVGALADQQAAALTDIRADIQAIKNGATLDSTNLEANINRLATGVADAQELAGENPPAAPAGG